MPINTSAPKPKATPAQSSRAKAVSAQELAASRLSGRADNLNGLFQMASVMLLVRKQLPDATAVAEHGPNISIEAARIADKNPEFAKVLDMIGKAGPYTGLITACMPLILQIMANHKMMPAEGLTAFGVMPPEALAAKAKADAEMRVQEMLKAASDRQAEVADLKASMKESANAA
jgi:hypothetical protein